MNKEFERGYSYILDNVGANIGINLSEQWIGEINNQVSQMCSDMISISNNRPHTDVQQLQGWINEIWHKYTFNTNAVINNSGNRASIPSAEGYASVDNLITDKDGNELASFSLKSKKEFKYTAKGQAESPYENYLYLKAKASRAGKEYISFDDFLKERGLKNDDSAYMSKYLGQGKVVNSNNLEKVKEYILKKYASSIGSDELNAARYKEVLDTLCDIIYDKDGNESISLSYKDSIKLAEAAKKGNIEDELLKECGLDINDLVKGSDILKKAFTSGLTAAAFSMIISIVPSLIDVIAKVIKDENLSSEDFINYGLNALSAGGKSFVVGSITAAITICCKTGKLGENLIDPDVMGISSIVVIVIGTIISAIKLASNKISRGEMVKELMQLYTTTGFAFLGGTILTCICEGFPFAYMIGSFVGSVIGGFFYKLEDYLLISFCREHNCTFFGLVEQDYSLPDSVYEELGLDKFGFNQFTINEFSPFIFQQNEFVFDNFSYNKFGVKVLKRDLIGIYKFGYIEDF